LGEGVKGIKYGSAQNLGQTIARLVNFEHGDGFWQSGGHRSSAELVVKPGLDRDLPSL
jgi:hypothetical protein